MSRNFAPLPFQYVRIMEKIQHPLILLPATQISVIQKNGKLENDKAISQKVFYITLGELKKCIPDSIIPRFAPLDSILQVIIDNSIYNMHRLINSIKQAKKYAVPDSFVHLFDTSKVQYVFCTCNGGFMRNRENLVNNEFSGEVVGFITGFGWKPFESSTLTCCFIIDLKKKNIIYFERDVWKNRDPSDVRFIHLQLSAIINHYFM
jgi:hypothetical protein